MTILFKQTDLIQVTEDESSHVVVLEPEKGKLTYYFLATWEKEPEGIKNKDEFVGYLKEIVQRLNHPVIVQY